MAAPRFVHLRLHSEYSIIDGMARVDAAVDAAAADGMPALAITDMANVFGMVKFYGASRAAGVKPLIGADCWLQNEADRDKPHRLLLLCQTRAGYLRLCELRFERALIDDVKEVATLDSRAVGERLALEQSRHLAPDLDCVRRLRLGDVLVVDGHRARLGFDHRDLDRGRRLGLRFALAAAEQVSAGAERYHPGAGPGDSVSDHGR